MLLGVLCWPVGHGGKSTQYCLQAAGAKSGRIQGLSSSAREDLATSISPDKERAASTDGRARRVALGAAVVFLLLAEGLGAILSMKICTNRCSLLSVNGRHNNSFNRTRN